MQTLNSTAATWFTEIIRLPSGRSIVCLWVTQGVVDSLTWQALEHALLGCSTELPVLLASEAMGMPVLSAEEQVVWLTAAGQYRQTQELFKYRGGRLLSLVTNTLVGGTYLVHGMAASVRLIYETAQVYPALSPEIFESLFEQPYPHNSTPEKALHDGVVTAVVTPESWTQRVMEWLDQGSI